MLSFVFQFHNKHLSSGMVLRISRTTEDIVVGKRVPLYNSIKEGTAEGELLGEYARVEPRLI